jgi:hypothetical protein
MRPRSGSLSLVFPSRPLRLDHFIHFRVVLLGGGVQVALSSRALAREAESDVVWATLFLRRFGTDFWGEDAAPHPYHLHDPFSAHIPFPFW